MDIAGRQTENDSIIGIYISAIAELRMELYLFLFPRNRFGAGRNYSIVDEYFIDDRLVF
jgi:hypothetical protein